MTDHLTRDQLRSAVFSRLATFTEHVEWIGGSADLAFADSVIGLIDILALKAAKEASDETAQWYIDRADSSAFLDESL